jgi:hypothetical protein
VKNTNKNRFAIARAELDERTIHAALNKAVSKVLKSVLPVFGAITRDFLERKEIDGFYLRDDLINQFEQKLDVLGRALKPEIFTKEMILYGERRLHAKAGGNSSAVARQAKNSERDKNIILRYQALCERGCKSGAASIIAKSYNLTPTQARNIIRQHKKNES